MKERGKNNKPQCFIGENKKKLLLKIIAFSLKLKQKVEVETLVIILYLYLILKGIFQNTYCTKNVETFIFKNRAVINNHTFLFSSELLSPYFKKYILQSHVKKSFMVILFSQICKLVLKKLTYLHLKFIKYAFVDTTLK